MASNRGRRSDWSRQKEAAAREAERQRKAEERARIAAEKEKKRLHTEKRQAEISRKNEELSKSVEQLRNILRQGLLRSARLDLLSFRREPNVPPLELGDLAHPIARPEWKQYEPRKPGAVSRALGGDARYAQRFERKRDEYERAMRDADERETARQKQVATLRQRHKEQKQRAEEKARKHNESIDQQVKGLRERTKEHVEKYLQQILERIPLPRAFPHGPEVTFNPHAEQVVVRFELPPRDVVPDIASYKYLPSKDEERTAARPRREVNDLYSTVVSQVALLCVRDLFESDPALSAVGFNGHVHAINPGTGEWEYPCIISLDVERESFPRDKNLYEVTPTACVRRLNAIVSNHPYDLEPIEPILDFDLSKYSFVEGLDAVSTLDSRPDLLQMSPAYFEHLVKQIFEAQGAEGWNTEHSYDDGVDAVIVKRTPLMGGLSIVQAKRYSKAVGVNHIRELAGAIEEKKAGWGILVTTSWFTPRCWQKAREHGRMELIDGERLKYLVKEHLNKDVLIGIPNRPRPKNSRQERTLGNGR